MGTLRDMPAVWWRAKNVTPLAIGMTQIAPVMQQSDAFESEEWMKDGREVRGFAFEKSRVWNRAQDVLPCYAKGFVSRLREGGLQS